MAGAVPCKDPDSTLPPPDGSAKVHDACCRCMLVLQHDNVSALGSSWGMLVQLCMCTIGQMVANDSFI